MDSAQALWGAGNATAAYTLECTSCHDPHGSSNYRLLKDWVNGENVASMVFSSEPTYPTEPDGWLRYDPNDPTAAIDQMDPYRPQYTDGTKIARSQSTAGGSLSTWCSACHQNYNETTEDSRHVQLFGSAWCWWS